MNRRKVVGGIISLGTVAISGCSSILGSSGSPEDTVQTYLEAFDDGDYETMIQTVAAPGNINVVPPREDFVNEKSVTINNIRQEPVEESIDREQSSVTAPRAKSNINQIKGEVGISDSAEWENVFADVQISGESSHRYYAVVDTDDGWKILTRGGFAQR